MIKIKRDRLIIGMYLEIRNKNKDFPEIILEKVFISSIGQKSYDWKEYQDKRPFKENFSSLDDTFFHCPDSIIHLSLENSEVIQTPECKIFLYDFWEKENGGPEIE
ncbi:hypothetical protein LCGC14_1267720 [marine sediment metagenome]|uniref:Uncharacterized protein n=1 Tax=marine sediment metagenome TaxID=412755 RepID=A0A0F9LJV3_9ZZZZ